MLTNDSCQSPQCPESCPSYHAVDCSALHKVTGHMCRKDAILIHSCQLEMQASAALQALLFTSYASVYLTHASSNATYRRSSIGSIDLGLQGGDVSLQGHLASLQVGHSCKDLLQGLLLLGGRRGWGRGGLQQPTPPRLQQYRTNQLKHESQKHGRINTWPCRPCSLTQPCQLTCTSNLGSRHQVKAKVQQSISALWCKDQGACLEQRSANITAATM